MNLNKLIESSCQETAENRAKASWNSVQQDNSKLKPYDNTALLNLIDYMNEFFESVKETA